MRGFVPIVYSLSIVFKLFRDEHLYLVFPAAPRGKGNLLYQTLTEIP